MSNIKYYYKGLSLNAYCKKMGICFSTITKRIHDKHMTIDEAINTTFPKCSIFLSNGESVLNYCKRNGLNIGTVRIRMRRGGESADEAVSNKNRRKYYRSYRNNPYGDLRKRCDDEGHYRRTLRKIHKGWMIPTAIEYSKKNWR